MAHSISAAFLILLTTISAPDSISAAPSSFSLSPDISPLFPTPQLSPTESSSLPIIPSTPSPPKPDDDDAMAVQGPVMAVAPSGFLPDSSSLRLLTGQGCFTSFVLSALLQLSA